MKPSAALLAGLLAGLSLGGVALAQPPSATLALHAVLAQSADEDEEEDDIEAKIRKLSPKQARCVVDCQTPAQSCSKRCDSEDGDCLDRCGQRLMSCIEKCGVDVDELAGD